MSGQVSLSIGIDGTLYSHAYFGGAVTYLKSLAESLSQAGAHVVVHSPRPVRQPANHLPIGVELVCGLPAHCEVWLTDNLLGPRPSCSCCVAIVHDTMELEGRPDLPETSSWGGDPEERRRALESADLVAVVSEATRHRLLRLSPGLAGRTVLVRHGCSPTPRAARERSPRRSTVLHVGGRDGYKNFALGMAAFASSRLRRSHRLVSVGGPSMLTTEEARVAAHLGIADRVDSVGYCSSAELIDWYLRASVVLLPSLDEGFGLPLLEAMNTGVPVACSDIAPFREVGGEVPYFFDPSDAIGAGAALDRAALADEGRLDAGRRRAAGFRWVDAGSALLDAIESVTPTARVGSAC